MRLTDAGRDALARPSKSGGALQRSSSALAPSRLRAVERAVEILERRA